MNPESKKRLFEVFAAHSAHSLTAEEHAWLQETLRHDAEARRLWFVHQDVELGLHAHLAADSLVLPNVSAKPTRWLSWRPLAAAAAMAACLALAGVWLVTSLPKPAAEDTTASVAVLTRGLNLEWESAAIAPGTPLSPGLLKLRSGIAQIEFYQGARISIEGPAEFRLVSSGEATCTRGKLSASVPPQARGFRINTPKGTIVDLGTEFGLDVSDSNAEVHVFKGEVEIHRADASMVSLKEGQAMALAAGPQALVANAASFASVNEIDARTVLSDQAQLELWKAETAKMRSDPSLKVHFDFQDDAETRSLRNHAAQGEDGSIVGASWTTGRWAGKGALEFRRLSDRVRLNAPTEAKELTMAMWVRVNGLDRPFNSLFMSEGSWNDRKVHWQILRDGRIRLGIAGRPGQQNQDCDTDVFFTPERFGRWIHLAIVFDPVSQEVRHYANGLPLATVALLDTSPLKPGIAELGNWNKLHSTSVAIRHLSGTMDEFLLWERSLSATEIKGMAQQTVWTGASVHPPVEALGSKDKPRLSLSGWPPGVCH